MVGLEQVDLGGEHRTLLIELQSLVQQQLWL